MADESAPSGTLGRVSTIEALKSLWRRLTRKREPAPAETVTDTEPEPSPPAAPVEAEQPSVHPAFVSLDDAGPMVADDTERRKADGTWTPPDVQRGPDGTEGP
jgi:hypothetical protein